MCIKYAVSSKLESIENTASYIDLAKCIPAASICAFIERIKLYYT